MSPNPSTELLRLELAHLRSEREAAFRPEQQTQNRSQVFWGLMLAMSALVLVGVVVLIAMDYQKIVAMQQRPIVVHTTTLAATPKVVEVAEVAKIPEKTAPAVANTTRATKKRTRVKRPIKPVLEFDKRCAPDDPICGL